MLALKIDRAPAMGLVPALESELALEPVQELVLGPGLSARILLGLCQESAPVITKLTRPFSLPVTSLTIFDYP